MFLGLFMIKRAENDKNNYVLQF